MWINIIFHRIATSAKDIRNDYELTEPQFVDRLNALRLFIDQSHNKLDYRFYFDDGDKTFLTVAKKHLKSKEFSKTTLGIITNKIDTADYLSAIDIKYLSDQQFEIASHSVSHPALAFYQDGYPLPTTKDGEYKTSPFGHTKILTEQEVLYQLIQSYDHLKEIGIQVNEFVLPHGCYNEQTIQLAKQTGHYKTISTCDPFLDTGMSLRPRLLTRHSETLEEFRHNLNSLVPSSKTV
jgi:hypothetical protein